MGKEDQSFLEGLNKQEFKRCKAKDIFPGCLSGRSIFPCLAACFEKITNTKITPKCMQCTGGIFTCGSKQCGNKCSIKSFVKSKGKPKGAECIKCFREKCLEKVMDCGFSDKAMRPTARAMSSLF